MPEIQGQQTNAPQQVPINRNRSMGIILWISIIVQFLVGGWTVFFSFFQAVWVSVIIFLVMFGSIYGVLRQSYRREVKLPERVVFLIGMIFFSILLFLTNWFYSRLYLTGSAEGLIYWIGFPVIIAVCILFNLILVHNKAKKWKWYGFVGSLLGLVLVFYILIGFIQFFTTNPQMPISISPMTVLSKIVSNSTIHCAAVPYSNPSDPYAAVCTNEHAFNNKMVDDLKKLGESAGFTIVVQSGNTPVGRIYTISSDDCFGMVFDAGVNYYNSRGGYMTNCGGLGINTPFFCQWLEDNFKTDYADHKCDSN